VYSQIAFRNVLSIKSNIPKIVSGGQTGVDHASLDWGLSKGIVCGCCVRIKDPGEFKAHSIDHFRGILHPTVKEF